MENRKVNPMSIKKSKIKYIFGMLFDLIRFDTLSYIIVIMIVFYTGYNVGYIFGASELAQLIASEQLP